MTSGVLVVSLSRLDSCGDDLRAFLDRTGRSVHAVEARLTKDDGVVFASELWPIGTRELAGVAEEIATWIADSEDGKGLEAVVTIRTDVWGRRRRFVKSLFQRRRPRSQ